MTDERRFFPPSVGNNSLLPAPVLVHSPESFDEFLEALNQHDPFEYAAQHLPDSEWVIAEITNLSIFHEDLLSN